VGGIRGGVGLFCIYEYVSLACIICIHMYTRANIENIRTYIVVSFVCIYVGLFCAYTCLFGLHNLHILVYTCEFREHSFVRVCCLFCVYIRRSLLCIHICLFGLYAGLAAMYTYIQMRPIYIQMRPIYIQMRPIYIQMRPIYIHKRDI